MRPSWQALVLWLGSIAAKSQRARKDRGLKVTCRAFRQFLWFKYKNLFGWRYRCHRIWRQAAFALKTSHETLHEAKRTAPRLPRRRRRVHSRELHGLAPIAPL